MKSPLIAVALVVAVSTFASAQGAPPPAVRGVIERVAPDRGVIDVKTRGGGVMDVMTRGGEERTLRLAPDVVVTRARAASLADVKPGLFVGVAALPGGDGAELKALEVHIFPESMRGVGEGFRPFDLAPQSSMTNGDVTARVDRVEGARIVVSYNGGERTIALDKSTPVVALEPGGLSDLVAGAAIVARGVAAADGAYEARRVVVGVGGVTPPM
jgi:hypothetical protein